MKKAWIHKANSFKEAEEFDEKYYSNMNGSERLDMVQFLREEHFRMRGQLKNAGRKRLRRHIKIIQ
jgi:hypothetical protein